MKVNYVDFVKNSMDFPEFTGKQKKDIVDRVFHSLGEFLKSDNDVTIPNLGTFGTRVKIYKKFRNPQTGKVMMGEKKCKRRTWQSSKEIKLAMNK